MFQNLEHHFEIKTFFLDFKNFPGINLNDFKLILK